MPNSPRMISAKCLTYPSFDVFAEGFCWSERNLKRRLREYPLWEAIGRTRGMIALGEMRIGRRQWVLSRSPRCGSRREQRSQPQLMLRTVTDVKAMSANGARTAASGFSSKSSIDMDECMPGFNNRGRSHHISSLLEWQQGQCQPKL